MTFVNLPFFINFVSRPILLRICFLRVLYASSLGGLYTEGLIFGIFWDTKVACASELVNVTLRLIGGLYTVEPLLSGHPHGNGKWPLNRGWPLKRGS